MSHDKLFSLDEANALIPQFTLAMEKMQRISIVVREEIEAIAQERGEQTLQEFSTQQLLRLKPSLGPLFEKVAQIVQEIEQFGCHFKGLELGLVDFPATLDEKVVYLCWQYGEEEIAFYHETDEGFAGRRPLRARSTKPRYYQ